MRSRMRRALTLPLVAAFILMAAIAPSVSLVYAAPTASDDVRSPEPWEVEQALEVLANYLTEVETPQVRKELPPADASPVFAGAALNLAGQMHLSSDSAVFRDGELLLWDDGISNVGLGRAALKSMTSGSGNTAVGKDTMSAGTSIYFNTAVGFKALAANEGSTNAAAGSRAMEFSTGGFSNTAIGARALFLNTVGDHNTAFGYKALHSNSDGSSNIAFGAQALASNGGDGNTAFGADALFANTTSNNTALGHKALFANTSGYSLVAVGTSALDANTEGASNTALGASALGALTTGDRNTALGAKAGDNVTTGTDNIFIGYDAGATNESHTIRIGTSGTFEPDRAFIGGVRGRTTVNADAIAVVIDSAGQLGTVSSSESVKQNIQPIGELSKRLLDLQPVAFRYRNHAERNPQAAVQFGLLAEQVAAVFPELVVHDDEGRPQTVKYRLLSTLLLNEINEAERELARRKARLHQDQERLEAILQRLEALESGGRD